MRHLSPCLQVLSPRLYRLSHTRHWSVPRRFARRCRKVPSSDVVPASAMCSLNMRRRSSDRLPRPNQLRSQPDQLSSIVFDSPTQTAEEKTIQEMPKNSIRRSADHPKSCGMTSFWLNGSVASRRQPGNRSMYWQSQERIVLPRWRRQRSTAATALMMSRSGLLQ